MFVLLQSAEGDSHADLLKRRDLSTAARRHLFKWCSRFNAVPVNLTPGQSRHRKQYRVFTETHASRAPRYYRAAKTLQECYNQMLWRGRI